MNSNDYENNLLDAIEMVVSDKVSNAQFNKTIQAVVIERTDADLGKYKLKYQDSEIEAYATDLSAFYPEGILVNILVPNGDFDQDKIIINAVQKEKTEYDVVLNDEEVYRIIGGNTIFSDDEFGLCSYKADQATILYDRDASINTINLDIISLQQNIKNSEYLICAAEFRTKLDSGQQIEGNYGIVFDIDFKDNATGKTVTKSYIIDVDSMKGNPYKLVEWVKQYGLFKINSDNFISVKQIYIFEEHFPNTESGQPNDIFVRSFELNAADKKENLDRDNYAMTITKEGKGYFTKDDTDTSTIKMEAKLTYKNNEVTKGVQYYWFKENNLIDTSSINYTTYGGNGWECINEYIIEDISTGKKSYIPGANFELISKYSVKSLGMLIKCVGVRNGEIIAEGYCEIYNYGADYDIAIESDSGTEFYYDNGSPTITCLVDVTRSGTTTGVTYKWSYYDNNGKVTLLPETTEDNNIYNAAKAEYTRLLALINAGVLMPNAAQEELEIQKTILDNYKDIQRVEGNQVINIDLSRIVDSGIFKCTAYDINDLPIGTASILITNHLTIEGEYFLLINNGMQTFSYDSAGISPANKSLENPIEILPLSFDIVDSNGRLLGTDILEQCEINWTIPKNNSLIEIEEGQSLNELELPFSIADKYDINKLRNNTINLNVKYKTLNLNASTTFTFSKDGEPGINGTNIVCKIVPNTREEFTDYPMIMNGILNFTPIDVGRWFRVQIWDDGEKVWEGTSSNVASNIGIEWAILKNRYTDVIYDPSYINCTDGIFSYTEPDMPGDPVKYNENSADIVKVTVTYKDKFYYCTLPIIVGIQNEDYRIKLVKGSGFRYVEYDSSGKQPRYNDTNPFTIQVEQKINNIWEDITDISNRYRVSYNWSIKGKIFNGTDWVDDLHLTAENLTGNSKIFVPGEEYDGENVTNAVEVKILTANLTEVGKLHIPIHFYLSKYGIAAVNGWDGNHISLDNGRGAILAPQVAAGSKDPETNTFTGLIMGKVKENNTRNVEQGLFAFHEGDRTFFLDAESGKAEFGGSKKGRIILDPREDALITSGDFVRETETESGSGMQINLTLPEIRWGNGRFVVGQDGQVICTKARINGNVIKDEGVLTNFVFPGETWGWNAANVYEGAQAGWVGWNIDTDSWDDIQQSWINFSIRIPANFTVQEVRIVLEHTPMYWYDDNTYYKGVCKNLHLYNVENLGGYAEGSYGGWCHIGDASHGPTWGNPIAGTVVPVFSDTGLQTVEITIPEKSKKEIFGGASSESRTINISVKSSDVWTKSQVDLDHPARTIGKDTGLLSGWAVVWGHAYIDAPPDENE